jgi:hypothetical protein
LARGGSSRFQQSTAEDVIEFQVPWTEYGSKQTSRGVITRSRSFFRYCMKRKWLVDVPEFDKVPADTASDPADSSPV